MTAISYAGRTSTYEPGAVVRPLPVQAFAMPAPEELDRLYRAARARLPEMVPTHLPPAEIEQRLREDFATAYHGLAYLKRTTDPTRKRDATGWGEEIAQWLVDNGTANPGIVWGAAVVLAASAWGDIPMLVGTSPAGTYLGLDRHSGAAAVWLRPAPAPEPVERRPVAVIPPTPEQIEGNLDAAESALVEKIEALTGFRQKAATLKSRRDAAASELERLEADRQAASVAGALGDAAAQKRAAALAQKRDDARQLHEDLAATVTTTEQEMARAVEAEKAARRIYHLADFADRKRQEGEALDAWASALAQTLPALAKVRAIQEALGGHASHPTGGGHDGDAALRNVAPEELRSVFRLPDRKVPRA